MRFQRYIRVNGNAEGRVFKGAHGTWDGGSYFYTLDRIKTDTPTYYGPYPSQCCALALGNGHAARLAAFDLPEQQRS